MREQIIVEGPPPFRPLRFIHPVETNHLRRIMGRFVGYGKVPNRKPLFDNADFDVQGGCILRLTVSHRQE